MEIQVGHFYTYKKGKRRWPVELIALTDRPDLVIIRGSDHRTRYVNPKRLRSNKPETLEKKLCGHITDQSSLSPTRRNDYR